MEQEETKQDEKMFEELGEEEKVGVEEEEPVNSANTPAYKTGEEELSPEDDVFETFIGTPKVGESVILHVNSIVKNPNTKGMNKETGEEFGIGLQLKNGTYLRRDIIADEGRMTIKSWEVFYKVEELRKKAIEEGKIEVKTIDGKDRYEYKNFVVKITRNFNGTHATRDIEELAKLLDMTIEEAEKYKETVNKAKKDNKLYTVEMV